MNHKIKRGVSLYAFQEEMFLGQLDIEDCVAFAASIGATGIEILPERNMPSFPNISDQDVGWWKDLMARHGCERSKWPTSWAPGTLACCATWGSS